MLTPDNNYETKNFKLFEKVIQRQMDIFYHQMGWHVERHPTMHNDLRLNGERVEEKIRSEERTDILVEWLQDMITMSPGWFYTVEAERLNYIMCKNGEAVFLHSLFWPQFKEWLLGNYFKNTGTRGQYIISKRGWGLTLNLSIPIKHIPDRLSQAGPIIDQLNLFTASGK